MTPEAALLNMDDMMMPGWGYAPGPDVLSAPVAGEGLYYGPPGPPVATGTDPGPTYLVMLNGLISDLPLGLFVNRDEAVSFAWDAATCPNAHAERTYAAIDNAVLDTWIAVGIFEFDGPVPAKYTPLFELGD